MVAEHDKLGYIRYILIDTFWLMTFFESASFIGSQVLANWLLGSDVKKSVVVPAEILGMLSLYHSFLISFSVEILGMFRY